MYNFIWKYQICISKIYIKVAIREIVTCFQHNKMINNQEFNNSKKRVEHKKSKSHDNFLNYIDYLLQDFSC